MDLLSETSSDESSKPPNKKNTYICTYEGCTAAFSKNSKLVYHIRRHTGERPFVCDEPNCGKTYLYSFHLRRHKETHHGSTSSERVVCTYEGCYLELANKYTLKKHIRRKHNQKRQYPYCCDECQQGFHRKRQLLQHSYIHTGVFPFICEICETRFPTTTDRNRHKRTHTSYSCACGEKFERWSGLLAHKKTCETTRPKCNICSKTFKQNANLKKHIDLHLSEKVEVFEVYHCGYDNCTRSYSYKKNLIYHINKYHKKIPLPRIACTQQGCQKTFTKKQNLKYHISRYHSNGTIVRSKNPREPRKDKGVGRTSAAALLAGLVLPLQTHRAIIKGEPVQLPPVPEDTTANKSICNPHGIVKRKTKENATQAAQRTVRNLKAKLKEALLNNLNGNKSKPTHCNMNNDENNKSYVQMLS